MEQESIFSKIITGELPAYRLWENDDMILILDINPVAEGHCLLIPKERKEYIFELDERIYDMMWQTCRWFSEVLTKVTGKRIGIAVEGLSIPHIHIHLVPIESVGDLDPCKARPASKAELEEMHRQIFNQLNQTKRQPVDSGQ